MLFAFAVCAAPILFVSLMVRSGRIGDLHMRESRERYIPYTIAIIGALCCLALFPRFGAGPILHVLTVVTIVELAVMLVGTLFMHISFHAAGMASIISATALMFGVKQGLAFLPVLLLVVLARLVLRRHTGTQIMLGALIGALTPLAVVAAWGRSFSLSSHGPDARRAIPGPGQNARGSSVQAAPLTRLRCRKRRGISSPSQR